MRVRWLRVALIMSLLANMGLALAWGVQVLSEAVLVSDTGSTFRYLQEERAELRAMRVHFCGGRTAPNREGILAWHASRQRETASEPFEKDGLLWLNFVGARFDEDGILAGICLPQTWDVLDEPAPYPEERTGELCPLERLC